MPLNPVDPNQRRKLRLTEHYPRGWVHGAEIPDREEQFLADRWAAQGAEPPAPVKPMDPAQAIAESGFAPEPGAVYAITATYRRTPDAEPEELYFVGRWRPPMSGALTHEGEHGEWEDPNTRGLSLVISPPARRYEITAMLRLDAPTEFEVYAEATVWVPMGAIKAPDKNTALWMAKGLERPIESEAVPICTGVERYTGIVDIEPPLYAEHVEEVDE
jgi:hypothetical protein